MGEAVKLHNLRLSSAEALASIPYGFVRDIPGEYRVETSLHGISALVLKSDRLPFVGTLVAEYLKRSGRIYLRVNKVDPSLPEEYRVAGWKVRNQSSRADGTLYSSGGRVNLDGDQPLGNKGRCKNLPGKS